ncbi:unnamed protein product [Phytophthora lilii]|uniref:Unnamed protein product n=1 Tax=Phytophthora lilii TaxID=2077276 RepID=A0A9W7D8M1_9STRA|nr:unnamed protein product [Phytophthora lilii]
MRVRAVTPCPGSHDVRTASATHALEDLGRLELLPSASLASARALVAQFVALPARRDFVFVHPTTGARVADEAAVRAADLPFLCIALLPVKETAAVSGAAAAVEEQRRPRPGTAQPLPLQQQQTKQRPQTVESRAKRHAATPATDTNSSSEGGVVPKAKEKRSPLEKVSNTHEPGQSPEKDRGKQSNEKRMAESVPLRAPPKHVVSKKMDTEAKFTPDSKRASSAGLTATSRVTSNLTKTDMREAFENQTTKPRRRKTSVLIPKAANTSSTREPESPVNTSSTDLGTETLQFEQINVGPGAMETALASSTNQEVVTGDGTHAIFPAAPAIPEEPSSSDISINLQTPGHLRRSRRFKALTAAKLSEKSWAEDPEQCEVITDAQIEEFIRSMLDAFHTGMEGIDGHELDKSFLYYGVDYRPLELHGILLAWDTELAVRCNHVRGGVDGQLTQYLLKVLPVEGDVTLDDERLRQFEYTLNVFAAMRGWSIFTKLRAGCFEEKYPLQLIPPSDSRRLALLRLSDKDRQLFALATSDNSSVRFESWLADGMEITYVLLFGFLQSRRNSGPKALAKLDSLNLRQARIQAAIQKLSSFSFEVWKRLEFRTTDIEDPSMLTRLNELIKPFLRDSKLYSGELEGSVFLPSLIGYLNRKAAQLSQSLCGLLQSTHSTREPIQNTVLQCLRLLRQNLMQLELHSANLLTYVQTMGLKIFDVDKINATRTSSGLGRIYVNGKESMLTHHQCKLMTRDIDLKLKARWDQQQDLRNGEVSRYFFIGPKEVALEYVVIRSKPLRNGCCPVRWEERDALGRKEALQAFALLSDRLTSDALSSAAVGVGINIIHTDLLPHVGSLQCLFAILGEYPKATSISFGYCYDAASQATRVVFRVHADKSIGNYNKEGCSDLMSALRGVDRFLMSAEEDEGVAFCEAEGFRFLNSCLHGRERPWNFIKYGKTFIKYISMLGGTDSERLHEGILQALKRTLAIFPCAPNLITKENLNVIASLIDASSNASDIADDAVNVLQSMSSKRNKFKMTQPPHEILVFPMTETQKRFASQGGIDILMKTVMELAEDSARSQALQIAIIEILMTREISATTSGLLVHWREVLEFYVEKKAWIRHPVTPAYSAFLLRQIHTNFFSSSSFMEPVVEPCPCNCKRCSLDLIDSYSGIMQIFVKLMLTEAGVAWAQEEMYGPRNCVLFLKWSAHLDQCIPAMANLQEAIVQGLCDFLDRLTSSHQYLRLLSEIVPLLLELLHQQNCSSLHARALRVLSLTFRLAVDKKVWTIKMGTFLAAYYQVLESFCDDPSLSNMNSVMNNTLLNSNQQKQTIICSHILILLHEEHINFIGGSGQLSPVARSRTKSLLQTLASFCSLTWNSVLHPVCQIPALISLGWMLTSLEVAKDLIVLEMDDVLLALMDNENVVVSILATRALVVLLFQTLFSPLPRTIEQYRLKRLCNLLTTVLGSGSRLMLSPKRTSDVDNLQSIQFAANLHDSFLILLRYRTFNIDMENYDKENELEQENAPGAEWPAVHAIVASYEWNEPNRAAAEKLAIHLKLLAVFSAMTTETYEKSNTFLLSFEVDDALATGSYFVKKNGFAVLVDSLASKVASSRFIESDSGAVASMIVNPGSSAFFLSNYGYSFVLKMVESIMRLIRARLDVGMVHRTRDDTDLMSTSESFGTSLFYVYPIEDAHERELFQLCRAAVNALKSMQRANPESIMDEVARTKTTMLPLLDYPNKQIALHSVLCICVHLQTNPTKCDKLLDLEVLDKVIALFFADEYPPIQAAAFSCIKLAFADQKCLPRLQLKLFPFREKIVRCLRSPHFDVKKKAILFLVEAVFRLDDQIFLNGVAMAFTATDNRGLLMELFDSVSNEITLNPSAGTLLQLLVRLILKLDLVVHTGGDQLVHLFNFLHQIITQGDHVEYLERKSRLDVITQLLSQQLTQNELRNVANMLLSVVTKRDSIRHYLSGFPSRCIPKIVGVMDSFSEYIQNGDTTEKPMPVRDQTLSGLRNSQEDGGENVVTLPDENQVNYMLKMSAARVVYISHFTEDIYEKVGSRMMLKFSILYLCVELLNVLALSYQSRLQMIKGLVKMESLWLPPLLTTAIFSESSVDCGSLGSRELYSEKMALLWHASMNSEEENSGKESDTIVLANMMILARNRALLTPGLQGRSADEGIISQLAHLLVIGQFALKEVALLASDVLANLLYVQVDVRSEKQLRAVLWRYTRAMSPNKPTQDPNHPSSKRLTAYLHNWIEPMLHKLRQSSFGTFHEDHTQLLGEELAFTLQNLEQPSVAALLCMLVSLHLPVLRQDDYEMGKNNNELEDEDLDTIPPYKYEETKPCRAQSLQYVFGASERSVREANDSSFSGSAHLWLFLRKLLDLANDELQDEHTVAQEAISEVKDIVVNRVPLIFKCWSTVKDNKFSTVAFDRRKHFLDFVIAVGKIDGRLSSMVDGKDMVGLVVNCVPDFATIQGRDYLLVCNVCKHNPTNIDLVMQRFGFDNSQLGTTPSEFFRLFWSPVRLNLLPVKFSIGDRTKLEILDPSSEVNLTTIFGLELLRILAARFPNIVLWYAQCHGHSQLLEIMLLASKVSALQMQHILVRTFLSNLLDLINQLVDIAPTRYHRIFSSDPRYLRCIVGLIYAPAHEVQTTAIKLLQNLAQQPRIFGMLSRLENLVEPLATVNTEVVSYVGETVAIYELSPPLSQNSMILLAHLLFVPFFTDITFTELVKLAFGFNPCGHSTQDVWIIALNDGNFNAIPDWMIVANDVMETAFTPAIKRMQKRFDTSIGGHREKSFYGIDKTAYFYHTSDMTRKRIGMRLSKLIKTYNDDKNVYRGSMRARNGLVMRLCRLLVEDRAEIIRRVAYTKGISERVLLEQMRSRTLSDLLLLLQEAPIFEGIQRDILACLAFRLGEPTEFIIDEPGLIQKLPLVLIFNEFVEFEMHIPHTQDSFRGTVSRGGLLGFPPWLEGKKGMEYSFIVHKCGLLATVISMEALEAELPESALGLVYQRLRLAYAAGDIQAISYLTGLGSVPALKPERRLQMSASSLIVQLTTAEVFVNSLLNDEWAVGVIADVALGVLSAPIVLDALTILAAMTANEVYTERFCVKLSATRHWIKEKERVTIDSPLEPLARFVNQFKLRLWEDHPAILEQLFLLQFHASSHLHTFWGNLESIWTLGYLRSCLAMLRSNIGTTADAIGYHLSSAIPHRLDYILFSGHKLQLHLEIAKVIIRTESGNAVGKLKLFNALCTDELLREEMWIAVLNAPCNVGPILKFLAPAITDAMDSQNFGDLETYSSSVDFTSFVAKTFEKLAMSLADHSVLIPLEIEATFACITAVTSLPNQTKYFPTETTPLQASFLFKTALQVLRQLTSASKPLARQAIAAARSVVAAMVSAATGNANSFIDEFSEPNIQILCNGYERVSLLFSEANDNLQLLWLLTEYAVLLNCLLSLPSIRDVLWVSYLSRDESYKPFFTWACHWMVLNIHKWPHICALEQDRGAKLKLLMTAADKMQAETLSVVVHLCKHESIAEVISLQPRFGDVVIRIFTALHSYSHELDVKLVRLRLKVVCFIAEQLGTRIHINQWKSDSRRWNVLNSFCRHGNVSTLVTLCEHVTGDSVIECYAVRLLWLLARLTVSINASFNDNEISSQEWRELVPFIKLVLNSTSSLARTKSYVVGLLAELALAQRLTMNEHIDLVWETLKLIHGSILKFPVNTIRTLASSITSEYLSSRHWIVDDDSPMHESDCALWFALSYESQRYVLHVTILREGSVRLLNADFFPPLMCQTLLCDAITILSVNAESELWTQAQMYALRLIRWLMAFPEKEAEERSQIDACLAALQSYRLVGQREQFLTHCTNLFSKLWMRQFRCTVVEAMTAYVHQNIGASLEVATLREQGKVDLMAILLEILHTETEEIHVEESNIVGKCLQLFNAIIEFSLINAVYAAQPGSMRILSDLREKAIQQDLLITSDLPRTLFLIVRMLSGTTINSHQYLVNEVWEVARAILLHPFLDIRLDSAKYVLEVMGHSRMMRAELHSIITREWERCGKNVVVRLTNLLFSKPPVNSPAESIDQSIVILLVDAITQMCFSETLGECIQNDMQIVSVILRDYSYPWSVYQAQLINTLLAHNKLTQKHSHLSVQLFSPSDGIPTLHRQILLLNVLPSLTPVHCSLHIKSRDEFWNDILHCIVRELGTNTEGKQYHTNLLTATKALVVVLDFCDLRSIPSKIIFELREVLAQQVHVVRASNPYQKPQSYTPVLLADECILLEGATRKKQLELLELLSFSCLSKLFAVSATDELLVERYGTSCLEQWIRCSSCRDSNAEDDAILTFFNPLISYCLEYARQSEPFKVAADSRSYWRILTRLFASYQCVSFHYWIVKLLLQLFQGSQRSAFEHFTANNFKMDFIEILWWKVSALKNEKNFRAGDLRTLWYSLTNELCCNRKNALAIMERGFLEKFILWEDDLSTKTVLQSVRSAKLLRLLSSVFQGTSPQDHMHFFRNNPLIMEMLAERCINTIISISRMNEVKRDATLVLFTLTEHEPALASIRKMCCLNPFEGLRADVISSVQLREVSEMLLQCEGDLGSLVLVLRLVLKICESSYSVAALIHSRNDSECWPITSVLVDILEQCIRGATRPTQLENCVLRPILITTRIPANFLPFHLLDMLHTEATVLSLQLVHLCVADELVANSLESDTDLLGLLLACLATSNLEVSSTAAVVISSLIRRAPGTSDTFSDISQYVCEQGVYRYFEFFSDINTQTMQFISSPSEFPACFTLLLRWLRYYSLNLSLLNRSASKPNVHSTLGTATESVLYGYHEILTSSILELMLYIVSNYYFKIYRSSCGEADKSEHTLLLQSLLALCQRRSRTVESPDFEINSEDDTCIVSSSRVRSRALALVQLFCSLDLPFVSSREVFTNSQQMTILMTIIEQSRSTVEQRAAAQLMQELSLNDEIKQLIIGTSSLLLRLGAWLEMEALQLLAAAIVQRLATPSSKTTSSTNVSVFGFMPSAHLQLAQYLFVGLYPLTNHVSKTKRAVVSRCSRIHVTVLLEKDSHCQSGSNFVSTSVSVRMKFKIISSSGFCLRQFEYDTTFRNVVDSWHHDFLLEEAANIVLCTMYVQSTAGSGNLTTSKVKFTVGDGSFVYRSNSVTLEITEKVIKPNSASAGVVSRLLRQESNQLSLKLFKELMGIVVEFCKDYNIFCDSIIDLPSQILLVLATTVKFSTVGKMDVACFEALATWFPRNPSSSTFKSSVLPVLDLVGRLRQLACVNNPNGQIVLVTKPDNYSPSTASNFLDKLIELLASVEIGDISTTCLSKLFIENADVLLYLCAQFNPSQSTHTTFLSLVALALRNNAESCMVFSTQCGQRVLRIVFDAGIDQSAEQSEQALGKLLCYAALVVVRLARCPLFRRNFLLGMNDVRLFSRVAYELFARRPWVEYFPGDAAESLILGCGFLCNGLPKAVLVDSNTREGEYFASLFTTSSIFDDGLSIVETLLIFLGRPSNYSGFHHETTMNQIGVSSSDRLAASVLASLVEKLTPRIKFEQTLLQILEARQQINRPKTGDMVLSDPAKMLYKTLEQQCVLGMRNCIRLTRYDFQSDLNILRLTYYSGIRAGVRTGIIPAQCSGALQRFDQDHLLPTDNLQWHLNPKTFNRNSHLWQSSEENNGNVSSSKSLLAEDPELDLELRQLSLFANEHAELLSVLTVNRKKAMTTAIRVATRNARVLAAFHAMASIALDFYVDTVRMLQMKQKTKRNHNANENLVSFQMHGKGGDSEHTKFQEWLLLLEELAGLLCAGLHELDANYYLEIAHQFRSLILDLPIFLRKMERNGIHSRQQIIMLFLDNLHRLLKRATNHNELKVVAANGSGIVDQTKLIRERLRGLDVDISKSLGELLESPQGLENLSRSLVAMQYMWRRIMGSNSLEKAMASSKESASLLKKLAQKIMMLLERLNHPLVAIRNGFRTNTKKYQAEEFDMPIDVKSPRVLNSISTNQSQNGIDSDGISSGGKNVDKITSSFPFTSLELLLDHFGWDSIRSKRVKQLLQSSKPNNPVVAEIASAFGVQKEIVEKMTVLDLAECFHKLESRKKPSEIYHKLQRVVLEMDVPFTHIPFVTCDKFEMSLWRLMVHPIQRVRQFHLYQQMQLFVQSDTVKRQVLLNKYRQISPERPNSDVPRDTFTNKSDHANLSPNEVRSASKKLGFVFKKERQVAGESIEEGAPPPAGPWNSMPLPNMVISQSTLQVCDGIFNRDPFSDDAAMTLLRRKLKTKKIKQSTNLRWFRDLLAQSGRSLQYRYDRQTSTVNGIVRGVILLGSRLILMIAFWRHEELHADLQDPVMIRAFDNSHERDEYFYLYHAKKGLGELVRVWMPTSGRLGLHLWQERHYALGGTLLSFIIALWIPTLCFSEIKANVAALSRRNIIMTRIVYSYGVAIFVLSVVSIILIARSTPVSRYYQNVLAVVAILVELVQLNSLAFDSAVKWDETDELPGAMQWLGNQGITKFGVSSVSDLQAFGIVLLLLSWFLLLKCANKFQDTSVLLHRVLTKDLPALVHGFLYMSTISVFFSYLACVDCSGEHGSNFTKCKSDPESPPFLIAHQSIECWTSGHQRYALLGLWGITFFLPIGLLAHGMSQVLFQRETLDIKYAPVLLLVAQLVKAVAATAKAFFPGDPLVLASLGVIGNAVLLVITLVMHSCSLWYIKYVKSSIYAASCWASLGAIHRLHYAGQSSTRSLNMIYFGWLTIGLTTAGAILVRVWRHSQTKQQESEQRLAAQQWLLSTANSADSMLGALEHKFLKAAEKRSRDDWARATFVANANKLNVSAPPPALKDFMKKARELPGSAHEEADGALFMKNARVMAKKIREHQDLRRRRW